MSNARENGLRLVVRHSVPSLNRLFAMNPWQRRREKRAAQGAFASALSASELTSYDSTFAVLNGDESQSSQPYQRERGRFGNRRNGAGDSHGKPTPQEQAMWNDPMYAKHRIELQRLEKVGGEINEELQVAVREQMARIDAHRKQGISTGSGINAPKDIKEITAKVTEIDNRRKENEAAIAASKLALMDLRKKYGLPATK